MAMLCRWLALNTSTILALLVWVGGIRADDLLRLGGKPKADILPLELKDDAPDTILVRGWHGFSHYRHYGSYYSHFYRHSYYPRYYSGGYDYYPRYRSFY